MVSLHKLPRYGMKMENPVSLLLRQMNTAAPSLATVSVNGVQSRLPAYYNRRQQLCTRARCCGAADAYVQWV